MKANFFIDSFTTETSLEYFDFVNEDLQDNFLVVNEVSGEIAQILKLPIYIERVGVKYRVSIVYRFGSPFLRITFTSKMLGKDYFKGFDFWRFLDILPRIMEDINCKINVHTFYINSHINDIDFTGDFNLSDDAFAKMISVFTENHGTKKFYKKKTNRHSLTPLNGIQFVNRKDASISRPFIKFYSKKDELHDNSTEFYNFLLSCGISVSDDLRRCEVTLKNKKHIENVFKQCQIPLNKINVQGVLSLSQSDISNIINILLGRYSLNASLSDSDKYVPKNFKKVTPSNFLMSIMALELMKEGYTEQQILNLLDKKLDIYGNAKTRLKKRLSANISEVSKQLGVRNLRVTLKDAFLVPDSPDMPTLE